MAVFFLILIFAAALTYMQKIFFHYELMRTNDDKLRDISFGQFFYRIDFSVWRIKSMAKLGSLFFLPQTAFNNADQKSITTVNLLIKLTLVFITFALIVLLIGLLTGTLK